MNTLPPQDAILARLLVDQSAITASRLVELIRGWQRAGDEDLAEMLRRESVVSESTLRPLVEQAKRDASDQPEATLMALVPLESCVHGTVSDERVELGTEAGRPVEATAGPATHGGVDRYRVKRHHASGGLGEVFIAEDTELGRRVAVKRIRPEYRGNQELQRRFTIEAELTGRLEHPGVVPVYGLGTDPEGNLFYAMRFIRGESLQTAIDGYHGRRPNYRSSPLVRPPSADHASPSADKDEEASSALAFRQLLTRFVSVCNTIDFAHHHGVLHRDIKPENIMLGAYGETLVVDWGIARLNQPPSSGQGTEATLSGVMDLDPQAADREVTAHGKVIGSPGYMSPEQCLGWHDSLTPCSDVFSLGATLYCLLTGQRPFAGMNTAEVIQNVMQNRLQAPRRLAPRIHPALEAICLKAMQPNANQRYESAGQLASDIESFLADEPVAAWKEPWRFRAGRWVRNHRALVATSLVSLLIFTAGSVIWAAFLVAANQRERAASHRADDNFQLARSVVDEFLSELSQHPAMKSAPLEGLRRDMLTRAQAFYQQLAENEPTGADLTGDQANAALQGARIVEQLETPAAAIPGYAAAIRLLEDQPNRDQYAELLIEALNLRAKGHFEQGHLTQALSDIHRAQDLLPQLRDSLPHWQCELLYLQLLETEQAIQSAHFDTARRQEIQHDGQRVLQLLESDQLQPTQKLFVYRYAVEHRVVHPDGQRQRALADNMMAYLQAAPLDPFTKQIEKAQCLRVLALQQVFFGDDADAVATIQESIELWRNLHAQHPELYALARSLLECYRDYSYIVYLPLPYNPSMTVPADVIDPIVEGGEAVHVQLEDAGRLRYSDRLKFIEFLQFSALCYQKTRPQEALRLLESAATQCEQLRRDGFDNRECQLQLHRLHSDRLETYELLGDADQAVTIHAEEVQRLERLRDQDPEDMQTTLLLARLHERLGQTLIKGGQRDEGIAALRRALETNQALLDATDGNKQLPLGNAARFHYLIAEVYRDEGQVVRQQAELEAALELVRHHGFTAAGADVMSLLQVFDVIRSRGDYLIQQREFAEVLDLYDHCLQWLGHWQTPWVQASRIRCLIGLQRDEEALQLAAEWQARIWDIDAVRSYEPDPSRYTDGVLQLATAYWQLAARHSANDDRSPDTIAAWVEQGAALIEHAIEFERAEEQWAAEELEVLVQQLMTAAGIQGTPAEAQVIERMKDEG